jgi:hypothetical protein
LLVIVVSVAPFEPTICTGDEQNPCQYVVRYHLILWLFAFVAKYSGGISAVATIAIAGYTIVLARVSNRQADLIKESIAEATKATEHAETTANAAQEQARIAWQALAANERAWLSLTIHDFDDFVSPRLGGAAIKIRLCVKNIGKTPAVNAHTRALLVASYEDAVTIGKEIAHQERYVDTKHSRMVLPQEGYERPWAVTLHPTESRKGLSRGTGFLPAIVACTTYQTLPDLSLHQTVVCYCLSLKGEDGVTGGLIKFGEFVPKGQLSVGEAPGGFAD